MYRNSKFPLKTLYNKLNFFSSQNLLKTALNDYHKTKLNGKMVEFAGT